MKLAMSLQKTKKQRITYILLTGDATRSIAMTVEIPTSVTRPAFQMKRAHWESKNVRRK